MAVRRGKLEAGSKGQAFWDHLEEFRKRLIVSITAVFLASFVCYFFSGRILSFLVKPLTALAQKAYFLSPYDAFLIKLQVSFWSGLLVAAPLLLTETWLFVAPGLYAKEKKAFLFLLFSSLVLFLFGLAIAFFAVIPVTLRFFLGFSTAELSPLISIEQYLSFVVWMGLAFGLAFEMPLFLIGLVKFGILQIKKLEEMRRYIVVGIFIFSAVVTPSPDPLSQCLLAVPLWILFEVSLVIGRMVSDRQG